MKENDKRCYYENLFADYPDVVDTETVRIMLGGINIKTVQKLIADGVIKRIHYLGQKYLVPKDWLIDYLLSDYYDQHKFTFKAQV